MSIGTPQMQKQQRTYLAVILQNRMNKTVVVQVSKTFVHPAYKKVIREFIKLKAHDERNECQVGDRVRIQETRPISKDKHWRVVEIVERSKMPSPAIEETPTAFER